MGPPPEISLSEANETLAAASARLLACRGPEGHWVGHLSSSALSTATAAFALALVDSNAHSKAVRRGLDWLATNQNADGGWGDTPISKSNISTTVLCWSALTLAEREHKGNRAISGPPVEYDDGSLRAAADKAGAWIAAKAKGLDGDSIARAIGEVYGDDRSFSAPILAMAALAGRLGPANEAWRHVAALPFELGLLSHRRLKWLHLPVVSYALPALIAIGQLRHHFLPPRCPVTRLVRNLAREPALRRLQRIQPPSGGFLEAIPLTAFVAMSLAVIGRADHPVVRRAVEFLLAGQRPDGSWPIDTNLSTWVTTLAIGALAACGPVGETLSPGDLAGLERWLTGPQHAREHVYTGAQPGAWAWTDLAGGVPDADDTAGAMLALRHLGGQAAQSAACAAARWLADIQNRDGGIPTFCRGWGKLPFDRGAPDLTAHAIAAWGAWRDDLPPSLRARADSASAEAIGFLARSQAADGSWAPLWFGNENAPSCENRVYGTARVLDALTAFCGREGRPAGGADCLRICTRAADWLARSANRDGGWGGDGIISGVEETALATGALAGALSSGLELGEIAGPAGAAARRGAAWLIRATRKGTHAPPSPIGLYFASLWYYEELYPLIFTVWAMGRFRRFAQSKRMGKTSPL